MQGGSPGSGSLAAKGVEPDTYLKREEEGAEPVPFARDSQRFRRKDRRDPVEFLDLVERQSGGHLQRLSPFFQEGPSQLAPQFVLVLIDRRQTRPQGIRIVREGPEDMREPVAGLDRVVIPGGKRLGVAEVPVDRGEDKGPLFPRFPVLQRYLPRSGQLEGGKGQHKPSRRFPEDLSFDADLEIVPRRGLGGGKQKR